MCSSRIRNTYLISSSASGPPKSSLSFLVHGGQSLARQIDQLGIEFPVVEEEPSAALGVELPSVLPATLIFDPDGRLVHSLVGPQTLETLAAATGQVGMPVEEEAESELQPR